VAEEARQAIHHVEANCLPLQRGGGVNGSIRDRALARGLEDADLPRLHHNERHFDSLIPLLEHAIISLCYLF
jgi:hypothetical protein